VAQVRTDHALSALFAVRQSAFAVRGLFAVRKASFAVRQGSLPCACARQRIFIFIFTISFIRVLGLFCTL
jgi:hypothetical protein